MNLSKKVGLKIKKYRMEKNLSQDELAYRTDMLQSQINKLENGKRRFNADQLEKISKALDVPVIRFFEDEIELANDVDNQQLLKMISQMQKSKRKVLIYFLEYLQNSRETINVEILIKAIEFANSIGNPD